MFYNFNSLSINRSQMFLRHFSLSSWWTSFSADRFWFAIIRFLLSRPSSSAPPSSTWSWSPSTCWASFLRPTILGLNTKSFWPTRVPTNDNRWQGRPREDSTDTAMVVFTSLWIPIIWWDYQLKNKAFCI